MGLNALLLCRAMLRRLEEWGCLGYLEAGLATSREGASTESRREIQVVDMEI